MWPVSILKRLAQPAVMEMRRQLCFRRLAQVRFPVDTFGRFRFVCGNRVEYYRTVEFGGEAETLAAFLYLLRPDDVVWDVGASVGLYAVHAGRVVSRVVAFEPDPATHRRLVDNVALNDLAEKVDCRQIALGDTPTRVHMSSDGLDGSAPSLVDLGRHSAVVEIEVDTADRLIAAGVPRPSVIKLDVEGAEARALEGAVGLLSCSQPPRIVFAEVHPQFLERFGSSEAAVESQLSGSGYRIVARRQRDDQYHLLAFHGWTRG